MSNHLAVRETISEARAALFVAVRIDAGRRAMEGDIESAYFRLEEARVALDGGDVAYARRALSGALELLGTPEARLIAQDTGALDEAIRLIADIRWE